MTINPFSNSSVRPSDLPTFTVVNTEDFIELGKRKAVQEIGLLSESKRRKWSVNSTIVPSERRRCYFTDPANHENLIERIEEGKYVLMHGPRASGKSTRTWRIMEQLQASGYFCLYISLFSVNVYADLNTFWGSFGAAVSDSLADYFGPKGSLQLNTTLPIMETSDQLLHTFTRRNTLWNGLRIKRNEQGQQKLINEDKFLVIFIDEFDVMMKVRDASVRDSFLGFIHSLKTIEGRYAVQSVVEVGTFNILSLNTVDSSLSPFNISDAFRNPNFTREQVFSLFREFATEHKLHIAAEVIVDIILNTNGHAGLVNLCGRAIQIFMEKNAFNLKGNLNYETWKVFSGKALGVQISEYRTFDKMLRTLSEASSLEANNLLRTHFLGFRGNVTLEDHKKQDLANILVSEGVLLRSEEDGMTYRISSPYVDDLIRRRIIPSLDTFAPRIAPPKRPNGTYDTLALVKIAVHYFNKEILRRSVIHAFKTIQTGTVNGKTLQDVPRESVYDSELYRVLVCWLVQTFGLKITGQWHVVTETVVTAKTPTNPDGVKVIIEHEFFDLVILTPIPEQPRIILELMASGDKRETEKHYQKALKYGSNFEKAEVWVIHFTCRDAAPIWPSEAELEKGLRVGYFWHDVPFTRMVTCGCWREGKNNIVSSYVSEDIGQVVSEDIGQVVSEDIGQVVSEDIAQVVSEDIGQVVSEDIAQVVSKKIV